MSEKLPFRVILRMEIFPGRGPEFEATWLEVGRAIARQPANLGQTLMRAEEEDDVYYVLTDWSDEPSFRAFERSEEHVGHRLRLGPFRKGGRMTLTQAVHDLRPCRDDTRPSAVRRRLEGESRA